MAEPGYPKLVWVLSPNRQGEVHPERWEHECHTGAHGADGQPVVIPHAASHVIEPGFKEFGIQVLARVYLPPEGYLWVRREMRKINPDERLMEPPVFAPEPEPEWIDDTG